MAEEASASLSKAVSRSISSITLHTFPRIHNHSRATVVLLCEEESNTGPCLSQVELDPEYAMPRITLGDMAMTQQDIRAALEHYSSAYRLAPRDKRAAQIPSSLAKLGL